MKKIYFITLISFASIATISVAQPVMSSIPSQKLYAQARTNNYNYKTYYNEHQDFSLTYPANIFVLKEPEASYSYGGQQAFVSKDGQAQMYVSGFFKPDTSDSGWLGVPLKELYAQALQQKNRVVTYKALGRTWYVVSGLENGKVFYEKFILKKDRKLEFKIVYPQSQEKIYDAITEQIVKSLK